jgi:hypothetical protein
MESVNTASLADRWAQMGVPNEEIVRALRGFNAYAEPFRHESELREA